MLMSADAISLLLGKVLKNGPFHGSEIVANTRRDVRRVLSAMILSECLAADYATQGTSAHPHPVRIWRERHPGLRDRRHGHLPPTPRCGGPLLHQPGRRGRNREPLREEAENAAASRDFH